MSIPILGGLVDERFLMHRLRSTSLAGVVGGSAAILLFAYRYYIDHFWSWDLLSIGVIVVGVKMTAFIWYRCTD
jgi:hypothetical protein